MNALLPDTLIRNPNGRPIVESVVVNCHAACLWAVVGNFSGFEAFIPALSHTQMTGTGTGIGALRTKFFRDGNVVVEQLNSRDEIARYMTWTTIYNTLGVARLWAAMHVDTLGAQCSRVTWTIIAEPVDAAQVGFEGFIQGFAREALENARRLMG